MSKTDALPLSLPPRGLDRVRASQYVGVSVTKFDEMVTDGRMPAPKRIDSRKVWDKIALDLAFDALPEDEIERSNEWDEVLQ